MALPYDAPDNRWRMLHDGRGAIHKLSDNQARKQLVREMLKDADRVAPSKVIFCKAGENIEAWRPKDERLHGGRSGYDGMKIKLDDIKVREV